MPRITLASILTVAVIATACGNGETSAATTAPPTSVTTSTTAVTAPPPPLPSGSDRLELGERWSTSIFVGCGSPRFFNDAWWVMTTRYFDHPDYPEEWPVEVLNQGAVDGPDAVIAAVVELVAPERIEVTLADGTAVAVYEPGEPLFCG